MPAPEALLTVDLDALAANHRLLTRMAGGAEVAPVVKADAYGLGMGPVARRLWSEGARTFFVARPSEGLRLRTELGTERPAAILVLDGCPADAAADLHASALTPVLNSPSQVETWSNHAAPGGERLTCAVHVDTGLNRLGLTMTEAQELAASEALRALDVRWVMSHLACAERADDPMNARQAVRFEQVRVLFPTARASLSNSAGVFGPPAWRADMVRPGITLYGGGPLGRPDPRVKAVATLTVPVLQVRTVQAGDSIGYGACFTAPRSMPVVILAAGYADGVLRASGADGYGWLGGAPRPFLGRISMDLIALDAGDCEVRPGDLVELLGPNCALDEVAQAAGTIAYEILTRIGPRVVRRYQGREA